MTTCKTITRVGCLDNIHKGRDKDTKKGTVGNNIIIPFDEVIPFLGLEFGKAESEMLELDISAKVDETTIKKDQVFGSNTIVLASNKICTVIVVVIFKEVGSNSK